MPHLSNKQQLKPTFLYTFTGIDGEEWGKFLHTKNKVSHSFLRLCLSQQHSQFFRVVMSPHSLFMSEQRRPYDWYTIMTVYYLRTGLLSWLSSCYILVRFFFPPVLMRKHRSLYCSLSLSLNHVSHQHGLYSVVMSDFGVFVWFVRLSFQIYTDFEEIRHEIEAETERMSGNNKVCKLHPFRGNKKMLPKKKWCIHEKFYHFKNCNTNFRFWINISFFC